jgi:dephospho-CoA kinase
MKILAGRGIPTISADDLAHACIKRGRPAYRTILRHFGQDILGSNGQIDRSQLGKIVFADPRKRKALEKIIHPCVAKGLKQFIRSHHGMVALDIPLLFEAHYESWLDKIVVIYCSQAEQIRRLQLRNHFFRAEALRRIRAQMPLRQKRRKADIVLMNTRNRAFLLRQARRIFRWG